MLRRGAKLNAFGAAVGAATVDVARRSRLVCSASAPRDIIELRDIVEKLSREFRNREYLLGYCPHLARATASTTAFGRNSFQITSGLRFTSPAGASLAIMAKTDKPDLRRACLS